MGVVLWLDPDKLVGSSAIAAGAGVSDRLIRKVPPRVLPFVRTFGGHRRYRIADAHRWLCSRRAGVAARVSSEVAR